MSIITYMDVPTRSMGKAHFQTSEMLNDAGMRIEDVVGGINHAYSLLDVIDYALLSKKSSRLSEIIEPANLSSVLGNFLILGIEKSSGGRFVKNSPHKYPDLLSNSEGVSDIEIKVALENNMPKSHLAKPGYYLAFRYFLGDESGAYRGRQERGKIVWIWEVRFGLLSIDDFGISNTPGDSGKTAVITKTVWDGMDVLFSEKNVGSVCQN